MTKLRGITNDFESIQFLTCDEEKLLERTQAEVCFFELHKLQELLRNCLSEYLNTPVGRSSRNSSFYKKTTDILKHYGYNGFEEVKKIKDIPYFLQIGYSLFEEINQELKYQGVSTPVRFREFKDQDYSFNKWLLKFNDYVKRNFHSYASTVFIHGSCADLQLTPFSDLDTFVILKRETLLNSEKLIKFKQFWDESLIYLYKFDSLQHHNHMIATDFDLEAFPYHWLPPQVIDGSTLLLGNIYLEIMVVKSPYFILKNFYQLLQRYRDPKIHQKVYNRYKLKNDISVLALFPVLFLQSLGIDSSKEGSFNYQHIKEIGGVSFYKEITEFRQNWEVPFTTTFLLSTLYQPYIRTIVLKFFMNKDFKSNFLKNSKLKEDFLQELLVLTSRMSSTLIIKHLNNAN